MAQDLTTYNAAGQQVRKLDRTGVIDGVPNCINNPVVDKNEIRSMEFQRGALMAAGRRARIYLPMQVIR